MSYPMLNSDLKAIQELEEFKGLTFGISRIQRVMKIGYNRAAILVEAAIEKGILVRDKDREWMVKLSEEKNEYYCQCDNSDCGNCYEVSKVGVTCKECHKGTMQPQDVEAWD
ncbi:hypothetical protein GA047_13470 [Vibrio cholerae]|nr:hypothetical protein [Vibrio cholerae]